MKIQVCSATDAVHGRKFYIKYKKFLFWHYVYWPKNSEGKTQYTNWYEPFDFKRYFDTDEECREYIMENLIPVKHNVVSEIKTD